MSGDRDDEGSQQFDRVSPPARSVWAKSLLDPSVNEVTHWLPLHQHLADTAGIAEHLWDDWLAPSVKEFIVETVGDAEPARSLAVWLAATHDVGKASPAFAVQVTPLAQPMEEAGLAMDASLRGSLERRTARHELVSYLAASNWLQERHEVPRPQANAIASVLAAHHGRPPDNAQIQQVRDNSRLIGKGLWKDVRDELLDTAAAQFVTAQDLDRWRQATLPQPVLALLSAFVIVADWIASSDLFELMELHRQPGVATSTRVAEAWSGLRMPAPWRPSPPDDNLELFSQRFELPVGARPRPVQAALMDAARTAPEPSLFILEAEMGVGKTEAALGAAEILAHRFGRSGLFIGLPTQATTDGMFARLLSWARRLDLDTPSNVFLAHGKRGLNEAFATLERDARFRDIGEQDGRRRRSDDDLVVAHRWFSNPKRGPLASFVVGTIDQALFGALRSRHLMLRHLALAGKVVILDEVHAYDTYMGQFLTRILQWLGAYRVPVILLSATLPAEKRREFVKAYDSGRAEPVVPVARRLSRAERRRRDDAVASASAVPVDPYRALEGDIGYPSIVASKAGSEPGILTPASTGKSRTVALQRLDDNLRSLTGLLDDSLREGGVAVVIRNTVRRAQETAASLRDHFGRETVMLAHARFLGLDRAAKDLELLRLFGRNNDARPVKRILVATQVVEQSLDLDFDLLVTDLAPIDLVLQRAGRLHRHTRGQRPAPVAAPKIVLTGVDWSASPPEPAAGSKRVYAQHYLLRTLAVLEGRDALELPADIPALVQAVYADTQLGPAEWQDAMSEARDTFRSVEQNKQDEARPFLLGRVPSARPSDLIGWVNAAVGDPDGDPTAFGSVRDGDPTLEVLALQRKEGVLQTPDWLSRGGGQQIPDNGLPASALTNTVLGCSLQLPAAVCRGSLIDRHIAALERDYPLPVWHTSHTLKGELVLVFDERGRAVLDPFELWYDPDDGLSYSIENSRKTSKEGDDRDG